MQNKIPNPMEIIPSRNVASAGASSGFKEKSQRLKI